MTEPVKMADESPKRKVVDWEGIEKAYRAGSQTLRQIAEDFGVSHVAIQRKAKAEEWPRDLSARIHQKAEQMVAKASAEQVTKLPSDQVTNTCNSDTLVNKRQPQATEKQIVDANAQAIAFVDLSNRKDVQAAINVSRAQLEELAVLGDPQFKETLEWIGEVCRRDDGKLDKVNEMYHYVIGLAGRVKMAKDIAASVGTYIPMQRKILKLDAETDKNLSGFDALLAKVNAQNSD